VRAEGISIINKIKSPLTLALSLEGRGNKGEGFLTPSPFQGEGWGEGGDTQ